jgi:hypothetical protein
MRQAAFQRRSHQGRHQAPVEISTRSERPKRRKVSEARRSLPRCRGWKMEEMSSERAMNPQSKASRELPSEWRLWGISVSETAGEE